MKLSYNGVEGVSVIAWRAATVNLTPWCGAGCSTVSRFDHSSVLVASSSFDHSIEISSSKEWDGSVSSFLFLDAGCAALLEHAPDAGVLK